MSTYFCLEYQMFWILRPGPIFIIISLVFINPKIIWGQLLIEAVLLECQFFHEARLAIIDVDDNRCQLLNVLSEARARKRAIFHINGCY